MIADPISVDKDVSLIERHFKSSKEPIFVTVSGALGVTLGVGIVAWQIVTLGKTRYYVSSIEKEVSREQFADYMMCNYPDHFEWLLFHPEWL